jgi:hypothetical protein
MKLHLMVAHIALNLLFSLYSIPNLSNAMVIACLTAVSLQTFHIWSGLTSTNAIFNSTAIVATTVLFLVKPFHKFSVKRCRL